MTEKENNEVRQLLLHLSTIHEGQYESVISDVVNHIFPNPQDVEKTISGTSTDFITYLDKEYPKIAKNVFHPPICLFYKGNIGLLTDDSKKKVSIAYTCDYKNFNDVMRILPQGEDIIYVIGAKPYNDDIDDLIIERYSKTNPIIFVLACGFNQFQNQELIDLVVSKGGLVITEYPQDVPYKQENFPNRFRVMNALSNSIMILSYKKLSGVSLLIDFALTDGKTIMTVPTNVDEDLDNNQLIYEGAIPVFTQELFLDTIRS